VSGNDCSKRTNISEYGFYCEGTVACRPIARECLGKQARKKYSPNNRVDPFLGKPEIRACNNRTSVARSVFFVVRTYPLLGNGCFLCCGPTRDYMTRSQQ
jgi:hypothetical protein